MVGPRRPAAVARVVVAVHAPASRRASSGSAWPAKGYATTASPPGDIIAASKGARTATMIELLTGTAALAAYLGSFIDFGTANAAAAAAGEAPAAPAPAPSE